MSITGTVFNIQRFSLHDGPGMRTTVFLKGCPLSCLWCHNPESKKREPQLSFFSVRCVGCGICGTVCPQNVHVFKENSREIRSDACIACGACVKACPAAALELLGEETDAAEVLAVVERDIPFYKNSGGGMTVSGGEPTMQPDFTYALLKGAKERGIHTAVETAGCTDFSVYERFIPMLDLILFDCKQTDPEKHRLYTGQSNERILENLRCLCQNKYTVEVVVRTPVIPGFNDEKENFENLAAMLRSFERVPRVEVLPYNPLAGSKYPRLGMEYSIDTDESKGTPPQLLCDILTAAGIDAKVLR